jgi:hypothetical protein
MFDPIYKWKFEPCEGNFTKDSMSGQIGHYSEVIDVYPTNIDREWAIYLNGKNSSYVNLGNKVGRFGTTNFTVAFWLFTEEKDLEEFDIMGNRIYLDHGNFFCIRMLQDGSILAEIDENSKGKNYIKVQSNKNGLNNGKWYHITVTRQVNSLSIYINGHSEGRAISFNGTANVRNENDFIIGRSLVSEKHKRFSGKTTFKDLRIYDQAIHPSKPDQVDLELLFKNFTPQFHEYIRK